MILKRQVLIAEDNDMNRAMLAEKQFVVYLQPQYRVKDNRLSGAEALVRRNYPKLGLMPPSEFILLFERDGFIAQLDRYVWDKTCETLKGWSDKGCSYIPVSVNVSRADVYQMDLADILLSAVEKYGLPRQSLHLEITESAYTENPEQIIKIVKQLRELGFVIEMEDFGSGYSSLNMLNKIPLDILKFYL